MVFSTGRNHHRLHRRGVRQTQWYHRTLGGRRGSRELDGAHWPGLRASHPAWRERVGVQGEDAPGGEADAAAREGGNQQHRHNQNEKLVL